MFEKFRFNPPTSEQKLRRQIHSKLKRLNRYAPSDFPFDLVTSAKPINPPLDLLLNLAHAFPKANIDLNDVNDSLRRAEYALQRRLNRERLVNLFMKEFFWESAREFWGMRYLIASQILSGNLEKQLISDQHKVLSLLLEGNESNPDEFREMIEAVESATEEMKILLAIDPGHVQPINAVEDVTLPKNRAIEK